MLRLLLAGLAFSCLVISFGACSSEHKSESCTFNGRDVPCSQMPDQNGKVDGIPVVENNAFSCGAQSCMSGTDYCQQFGRMDLGTGGIKIYSSSCTAKPAECNDCDCIGKYVKEHSCSGYDSSMCQSSNSQITMSCLR